MTERKRLASTRGAINHEFVIRQSVRGQDGQVIIGPGGQPLEVEHHGRITVGLFDDNGQPGEIFVRMAKQGDTLSGLMDGVAVAVSLALQHGTPLDQICAKFVGTRFEPSGWTDNPAIKRTSSPLDYVFRWLEARFLEKEG